MQQPDAHTGIVLSQGSAARGTLAWAYDGLYKVIPCT